MPGVEAWQAFAGAGSIVIFLGGLVFALRRLGIIRPVPPAAPAPAPAAAPASSCGSVELELNQRVHKLERELDAFKLYSAETYVRRDDHIQSQARIIGLLESHSVLLARLEERIGGSD